MSTTLPWETYHRQRRKLQKIVERWKGENVLARYYSFYGKKELYCTVGEYCEYFEVDVEGHFPDEEMVWKLEEPLWRTDQPRPPFYVQMGMANYDRRHCTVVLPVPGGSRMPKVKE